MKKVAYIYLIFLTAVFSFGRTAAQKEIIISIQKTSCYGTCPIFTMDIYSNCKVVLKADKFVKVGEGVFKSKLTKSQMEGLKQKFEQANFFEFNESYRANVTDLPTTFLYYNNGIREFKIEMYGERPRALDELDQTLIKLMDELSWKKKGESK